MKAPTLTDAQHRELAAHLDCIASSAILMHAMLTDAEPQDRAALSLIYRIGRATTLLRARCERAMARADGNDLRSWPTYYPDTETARTLWAAAAPRTNRKDSAA